VLGFELVGHARSLANFGWAVNSGTALGGSIENVPHAARSFRRTMRPKAIAPGMSKASVDGSGTA